ncbi:MAG: hypothetical protein KME11_02555 [Timaviella obliquedivisa GSE-PSE-MK23-08B]|jgi:hypothetical protein|nr:hypothetical protein [Timaviella obliquedivisa GSE-PSE-MK23-08B]
MQLEFVPVEEFYFALTLSVKTLDEIANPELLEQVRSRLSEKFGQPSTIAPSRQNFNYVFRVCEYDRNSVDHSAKPLIVSISDWQDKLRLSSDYGWVLDAERKPVRSAQFEKRDEFAEELRAHLQDWLGVQL